MAWDIFELSVNVFQVIIIIETISRYLGTKYMGWKRNVFAVSAIFAVVVELTYINNIIPFEGLAIFIPIGIIFIYSLLALKGSWRKKLFVTIVIMVMVIGITSIVMNVMGILFGKTYMQLVVQQNTFRFIAVMIIQIIIFYATRILLLKNKENDTNLSYDVWFVIIMLPCISIFVLSFIIDLTLNIKPEFHESAARIAAAISVGIFIIDILTYIIYKKLKKDAAEKTEYEILKQRYIMQEKNISDLKPLYCELQKTRHDIKHHINLLKILLEKEENKEALQYLNDYSDSVYSDNHNNILCDNIMINYIVNSKTQIMNRKNIRFYCNICDSIHGISDVDINIVLGNLLDNAIEACENISDEDKNIALSIYKKAGYLIVSVKNTFDGSIGYAENSKTSKKDKYKHGFGLLSVKDAVERYNGHFDMKKEGKTVESICILEMEL